MSDFTINEETRNPSVTHDPDTLDPLDPNADADQELALGEVAMESGENFNPAAFGDTEMSDTNSMNDVNGMNDPITPADIAASGITPPTMAENTEMPAAPQDAPAPAPTAPPVHFSDIDLKASAGQAVDQAKSKAGEVIGQAKETAGQAFGQAKDQVKDQLTSQKDRAADSLTSLTNSVQEIGATMRSNNLPQLAGYTETLAEQVDRLSGYLKNNDVEALVHDAEKFARENAPAFIAGGFILGIALGRFLRASNKITSTNGTSNALVPVGTMDAFGNDRSMEHDGSRQDINRDDSIQSGGPKPLSASGYVVGGVVGGAPA